MQYTRFGLFFLAWIAMGLSFLISPFRSDERGWFKDGLGILVKDGGPDKSVGVENSFERWWTGGRLFHDMKNTIFEWFKKDVKRAAKFSTFVTLIAFAIGYLMG